MEPRHFFVTWDISTQLEEPESLLSLLGSLHHGCAQSKQLPESGNSDYELGAIAFLSPRVICSKTLIVPTINVTRWHREDQNCRILLSTSAEVQLTFMFVCEWWHSLSQLTFNEDHSNHPPFRLVLIKYISFTKTMFACFCSVCFSKTLKSKAILLVQLVDCCLVKNYTSSVIKYSKSVL